MWLAMDASASPFDLSFSGHSPARTYSKEPLEKRLGRWKQALKHAAVGPLVVASEVVALSEEWESYKQEAEGLSCTAWLRSKLGKGMGLAWFKDRHRAVQVLGESCRRTIHHKMAVWVMNQVPPEKLREVKEELMRGFLENGRNPLTPRQGERRVKKIIGTKATPRVCGRCLMLEAKLKENGINV